MTDLHYLDLADLAEKVRSREISSVEVTRIRARVADARALRSRICPACSR